MRSRHKANGGTFESARRLNQSSRATARRSRRGSYGIDEGVPDYRSCLIIVVTEQAEETALDP